MRLNHTEVVSADELESIHDASLTILERIGMDIWDGQARSMLRDVGCDVDEAGQHVRFPKEMIVERIATAPAEFTLHSWNPEKNLHIGGNWMANGTVASAPHIVGLDGVRRTGDQRRLRRSVEARRRCSTRSTSSPATRSSRSTSTPRFATSTPPSMC